MGILLAFAPFLVFALVDRLVGAQAGLAAGAVVSFALLIRDWVSPGRSPKILEIGTAVLFGGLALYAVLAEPAWSIWASETRPSPASIMGVRLRVDAGLLLVVMASLGL